MSKLLTIAIPTYNRAQLLDRQLAWLDRAIKGFESKCEIIISDNCSTDNTPDVINKWQPVFGEATVKLNRQEENVGAIRNIAYCINRATSKHVWTISDDDKIDERTISYLLNVLAEHPELALIILNFSSLDLRTGKLNFERCFDVDNNEDVHSDGKALFERCLEASPGGVALTTALVYRTDLAQRALQEWPSGLSNLAVQIYVTGFCALHGNVKLTKDSYLECAAGTHFWMEDLKLRLRLRGAEMPETYLKLMELGYSSEVCQTIVQRQWREIKNQKNLLLKALLQVPGTTINVLSRCIVALWRVNFEVFWNRHLQKNQISTIR